MKEFLDSNKVFAQRMQEFLIAVSSYQSIDRMRITQALHYMIILQHGQKPRADGLPYPYHPLAVTERTLGLSPDEVIAALLHDLVEDQAEKLAPSESKDKRGDALNLLEVRFGAHVRFLVEELSNPENEEMTLGSKEEQRIQSRHLYFLHIQKIIANHEVARIKLFDFCENALLLDRVKSKQVRLGLRKKYLPVAQLFLEKLPMLSLEASVRDEIQVQLEKFLIEEG